MSRKRSLPAGIGCRDLADDGVDLRRRDEGPGAGCASVSGHGQGAAL